MNIDFNNELCVAYVVDDQSQTLNIADWWAGLPRAGKDRVIP